MDSPEIRCPNCRKVTKRFIRKWNYHVYEVRMFACICGESIRGYYFKDALRFTLTNHPSKQGSRSRVHAVVALDNECNFLKSKEILAEFSLLTTDEPFTVITIGTIKAMIESFPETSASRELKEFLKGVSPSHVLFGQLNDKANGTEFFSHYRNAIRNSIMSRHDSPTYA